MCARKQDLQYLSLRVRWSAKGEASQSGPHHAGVHPGTPGRAPCGRGGTAMLGQDCSGRPCSPGKLPCVACCCLPNNQYDKFTDCKSCLNRTVLELLCKSTGVWTTLDILPGANSLTTDARRPSKQYQTYPVPLSFALPCCRLFQPANYTETK